MENLQELLKKNKYKKIKFRITRTRHLLLKAKINGISGTFILDTGASNSCVGFESVGFFALEAKKSKTKAAGAGATGMITQVSKNNSLQIGSWKSSALHLVIFDLSHVNEALTQHKAKPVNGIIGADILIDGKAILDYDSCNLYLR
ncbi:retropepsin-like aspartic protease [Flavobacterium sp. 3HN19-14]|uniref:retropepsin-like aspartic protease n=1 Tax=Flavobacterium sp. 3HN19-14 TaxID=3448133 RepID=UPI003EDF2CD8